MIEITNKTNSLIKIIDCSLYSTRDLCKIMNFYQDIGFKVEIKKDEKNEEEKDEKKRKLL